MSSITLIYFIKVDILVISLTLLLPVSTKNIVPLSENFPVGWDTLASSMNPSSAPLVPSPMIVSTFSTSFLPSKTDASRENRFNVCDVVSVKMTEWQFKLTPWIWLHKVLPFLGLERPGPKCPVISKQQLLLALNDTQSSRIDVLL